MTQKKRGLGRGLGALIPQAPAEEKPVDVFFPSGDPSGERAERATSSDGDRSTAEGADTPSAGGSDRRSASWDSAIAGGRLSIGAGESRAAATTVDPLSDLAGLAERLESEASVDSPVRPLGSVTMVEVSEHGDGDDLVLSTGVADGLEQRDPAPGQDEGLRPVPGAQFAEIPAPSIRPNPRQPRSVFDEGELDELVESVRQIGILQPIVVRPLDGESHEYELIMGERRWRAAQEAGLEAVPAIIRSTDDADMLRDALLENLHRAALNPLEEAAAYRQLLDDFGCTHEELATRIARSRPQISNTLRLLKLPPLVQRRVAAGVLSAGHARALLGLTDGAEIERLAQRIVSEGLSVRATEEIVSVMGDSGEAPTARRGARAGQRSEAIDGLATRLSDRFETRVKVSIGKTKGRMTVEFASVEDLNRILAVMAPEDPGLLKP